MVIRRKKSILTAGLFLLATSATVQAQQALPPEVFRSSPALVPAVGRPEGDAKDVFRPAAGVLRTQPLKSGTPPANDEVLPLPMSINAPEPSGPRTGMVVFEDTPAATAPCPAPVASRPLTKKEERKERRHACRAFYEAPPFGFAMRQHFEGHVARGIAARLTLYEYDFVCNSPRLNERGRERVHDLVSLLGAHPYPLIIERTPHIPSLAEARRLVVLEELANCAMPLPPERVVVSSPLATPLQGQEAELIYQTLMIQTRSAGFLPGTGGGGSFAPQGFAPGGGFSPTGGGGTGTAPRGGQ